MTWLGFHMSSQNNGFTVIVKIMYHCTKICIWLNEVVWSKIFFCDVKIMQYFAAFECQMVAICSCPQQIQRLVHSSLELYWMSWPFLAGWLEWIYLLLLSAVKTGSDFTSHQTAITSRKGLVLITKVRTYAYLLRPQMKCSFNYILILKKNPEKLHHCCRNSEIRTEDLQVFTRWARVHD